MTDKFFKYLHHRQRQEELRRTGEKISLNLQNVPNKSTQVALQSVTFRKYIFNQCLVQLRMFVSQNKRFQMIYFYDQKLIRESKYDIGNIFQIWC